MVSLYYSSIPTNLNYGNITWASKYENILTSKLNQFLMRTFKYFIYWTQSTKYRQTRYFSEFDFHF